MGGQVGSPDSAPAIPSGGQKHDINAALKAAMEAAKNISQRPETTVVAKPRASRFSNSVKTKKMYFPSHYSDIDYTVIFNSPWKINVETETHTTITVGGSSVIVTENDEPQHVLISASSDESAAQAEERIHTLFVQPEMARRLIQQYSHVPEVSKANLIKSSIGSIYDETDMDIGTATTGTMEVPYTVVGLIIGQQGKNVRQLRDMYGVTLNIQQDRDVLDGSVMRTITIRGREEMVEKTKEAITTIVKTGRSDIITSLQSSRDGYEKVKIPNDRVGLVIGRQGVVIKDLMSQTCTQIQVPHDPDRDDPSFRSVVITGDPKNVLEAKRRIQAIVDGQMGTLPPGMPTTKMLVPDDKVGLVIGKGGTVIKDIQAKTKAHVQIPGKPLEGVHPPVREIVIAGTEEQMQAVKDEIQKIIGTTAGTSREYYEQPVGMPQPWNGNMSSMFNQVMDLTQMQQYMSQMQMQMGGAYYPMGSANGAAHPPLPPPPPPADDMNMDGNPNSDVNPNPSGMSNLPPPPPPPPPMGMYGMGQSYPGYPPPPPAGMHSPIPAMDMTANGREDVPPGVDEEEAPPGM